MNSKITGKFKEIISSSIAAAMAATMLPAIPAFAATGTNTYSYDGYDVEYSVYNEWDNGQTVQIKVTNTGEDSILNWAFKYDAEGEINNLWNATVYDQQGEDYIIKNSGWNYEIAPGQSVNFGYILVNDEFTTPDSFTLCSKRVEKTSGYEIDLNIVDQWDTGIKAELAICNTSNEPLEAWTVSFHSNFTINNLWDGRILESSDNSYTVASEMWTNPIALGDSKKIGFTALINSDITPEISNCVLTEVEIDDGNENPDINWDDEPDTDGDGLPDSIEEYLGSDSNNIDTDDDGLSDYYEAIYTYTNPTKVDTDDSGVDDGDKDLDEDGLTNLEELENNTHPCMDDTDADGLSDGDEVKTHVTDPLVADTDGDGLDDGNEIVLGTNPLVQDTDGDGIIDSKEKIQQTFTHKVKNDDCAVTEVIVDMECTGNINRTTSVESVMNVDILCTEVVGLVGEPFEIETDSEFDKATLTFKIDKNKLGEIPFDNLLFLWYNEEEDEFVELETTLDEENSTASIETTHFSKYMVVDGYQWYKVWSKEFDYNPTGGGSGAPSISVKYNTVLAIDCSGSMDWNDRISIKSGINSAYDAQHPYTCNRITAAEGFIRYMDSKDDTAIVFFTGSASVAASMTNDTESLKLALQKMYSNGGTSFSAALNAAVAQIDSAEKISNGVDKNRILLLSDGDDGDSASRRNSAIQACKDRYIEVYTVGFGSANENILQQIADETGGKYYKALSADDIVEIFSKFGYENDFDMTDTDGDGLPDAVETVGIRVQNGQILYTDPTKPDTDEDGLPDGKEINPIPQKGIFSGSINNGPFQNSSQYYFKMESDPINKDSDGDGDLDGIDPNRMKYLVNDLFIHNTNLVYELARKYNKELSVETKYYNDRYIESLVFMYIRYFEITSNNEHKYCVGLWPNVAGQLDKGFVDYVKKENQGLYDYFSKTLTIASEPYKCDVDLNHMAATLSAILYNSNCKGGVKYGIMPEKHIDALAGWAGDMQSLIDDCFSYAQENQAKTIVDYFTEYLGDNDQRCGIDDLNSDADAVNIAYEILSKDYNDLNSVLTQYYTVGISKRYTTFIKTALNDSEKTIEPYTKTHYLVFRWPILDDNVKITSDESKEIRDTFWKYLNNLKATEEH